jgi:hypothetical protein
MYYFRILLDALLVYVGVYFILVSLGLPGIYAIIPALFYFAYDGYNTIPGSRVADIESKYPDLEMKLRTATEYANDGENPFVPNLHKEAKSDLQKVSLASFINLRKSSIKIGIIISIGFLMIFFSHIGFYFDVVGAIDRIPDSFKPTIGRGENEGGGAGLENVIGDQNERNIFGEARLAELGDDQVDLSVYSASVELSTRNVFDPTYKQFEENRLFPEDIFTQEAELSSEGAVSQEHMELVKNYFLKTASTG